VEAEGTIFGLKDLRAEDIGGKKVGGELDAGEVDAKRLGEGLGEGGLADARNVFEKHVSAAEHTDHQQLDDVGLAANDLRDAVSNGIDKLQALFVVQSASRITNLDGRGHVEWFIVLMEQPLRG
jgi:hypothetical protein